MVDRGLWPIKLLNCLSLAPSTTENSIWLSRSVANVPEYDISFGEKLAEVAHLVVADGVYDLEAKRTALYLSLLSCEISLKSMLEQAGIPLSEIRSRSHRLADLLSLLGQCEIEVDVLTGTSEMVSASRLRSYDIQFGESSTTVGNLVDAESLGASQYPNHVRYGDLLQHFPPEVVAKMASRVVEFAREHWDSLRVCRHRSH